MAGQSIPFTIAGNSKGSIGPIPFTPAAIGIDNPTSFYITFPDAPFGSLVYPQLRGVVIPAPTNSPGGLRFDTTQTPYGAFTGSTKVKASGVIFEDPQPYSPGYSAITGAPGFSSGVLVTTVASPTDFWFFASPTNGLYDCYITRIAVTGVVGTLAIVPLTLVRRSSFGTVAVTSQTPVPHDQNFPWPALGGLSYIATANPTGLGTLVGTIRATRFLIPTAAAGPAPSQVEWTFGQPPRSAPPLIVHPTTPQDTLALNLAGNAGSGSAPLAVDVEWYQLPA